MDSKHGAAAMIDPAEKQTASLPLEQPKRGRGRPKTGAALTPAQKQKAYRERLKSNVTENSVKAIDERMQLREQLLEALKRAELAEAERDAMGNELAKAKAKAAKAGTTKKRYVLQYKYEDIQGWWDDATGDYGSKKNAEKACKRMNEPGVSEAEWRVRERQWV